MAIRYERPAKSKKPKQDTPGVGHNAAPVKSFIERVLNLKAEQDERATDIRDVYDEARRAGWNKTAMGQAVSFIRKREKNKEAFDDVGAFAESYVQAYYGTGMAFATHAHEDAHQITVEAKLPASTPEPSSPKPKPIMPDIPESLQRLA